MIDEGQVIAVDDYWIGSFRGPTTFIVRDGLLRQVDRFGPERNVRPDLELPGTLFPRLTDHHVHLGLIDPSGLLAGGITSVVDLGWIPAEASRMRRDAAFPGSTLPEVHIAGAFLTCVGGYPKGRDWAPDDAVVELAKPSEAELAVRAQVGLGASVIKVTLNSDAGPVPSEELLEAVVSGARANGVPVAAHVQGEGMTKRALDAGVNVLAHTPFTERLDADLVARISRARTGVISTLDIHRRGSASGDLDLGAELAEEIAVENLRRIAASGGRVLYGTDLGNGRLPVGINRRELVALAGVGLDRDELVASIAGHEHPDAVGPRLAWIPGVPPRGDADPVETAEWLAGARGTTVDYLEETLEGTPS
ncbi:MAG: amidohydrolase family protein [Humibacter sp.]